MDCVDPSAETEPHPQTWYYPQSCKSEMAGVASPWPPLCGRFGLQILNMPPKVVLGGEHNQIAAVFRGGLPDSLDHRFVVLRALSYHTRVYLNS